MVRRLLPIVLVLAEQRMALPQQSLTNQEQQPVNAAGRPAVSGGSPARNSQRKFRPIRWLLKTLGPGLIAGASLGYAPLWLAVATFPLMAAVQQICARIGLVCGCGIAGVIRQHYSRKVLYAVVSVLLVANTINAAADLSAIAAGVNLLVPIPISWLILPVGLAILALQIWGSYRLIARIFKWLALTTLAYVGAAFFARPDWPAVLRGSLVPTFAFDRTYLMMLVAILGTTISPYLFFWQANQEAEEKAATGRKRLWRRRATDAELEYAFWDVNIGMFLSNVVMYFIILTTAATLHGAGVTDIDTAAQAAEALRPLAGDQAFLLMALGLIGTGVLTVPILTGSAAYAVAEAFGWQCSLDAKPARAK